MKRFVVVAVPMLAGVTIGLLWWQPGTEHSASVQAEPAALSKTEESGQGLELKPGSERRLGVFKLGHGRDLSLSTADTTDGKSCLIESGEADADSSVCLEDGLFTLRKVAFSVDSQGGPQRFSELHVPGVVASGIRSAEILKTDGSSASLDLSSEGAFVYESPESDLEQAIYPNGFRLYGPSGRLAETVHFPTGP